MINFYRNINELSLVDANLNQVSDCYVQPIVKPVTDVMTPLTNYNCINNYNIYNNNSFYSTTVSSQNSEKKKRGRPRLHGPALSQF